MTKRRVKEVINVAHDTCAWAYKHLMDETNENDL